MASTDICVFKGREIVPLIPQVARLRLEVFREYPYLYDGDEQYERKYLEMYSASARSVFVIALDGDAVVGASTGLPLEEADEEFQLPIREAPDIDPTDVFYFGESVLLATHRGRGIGHRFFDERERHAASLGFTITAFCAVNRPPDHPRKPPSYQPLDAFWRKRGYERHPDLVAHYRWKDLDDTEETEKLMTFWIRRLKAS